MTMAEPPQPPPAKPSAHVLQAPTGTRDFYPADLNRLRYIQDAWRRTSINHGFEEIDGPTFEHLDLYTIKSGEGIVSELFSFERHGGEKTYALRPEFTPTLARMYAAKANALPKPTKWFWMQNCFRAERPQRGRLREFSQWNCDIIGDDSPEADAEIIACCIHMLERIGLSAVDVRIRISHRNVPSRLFEGMKIAWQLSTAQRESFVLLLDAIPKLDDVRVGAVAEKAGFPVEMVQQLLPAFRGDAPRMSLHDFTQGGNPDTLGDLRALAEILQDLGVHDWIEFDQSIVRGLAYYTGMVFEVHEASGAERAIAGGGRYDGLIELFGGPPTPAVGFGMGDVVLSLVLQDRGKFPSDDEVAARLGLRPDVFVISNGTPEADAALTPTLAALRRSVDGKPGLHARRSYKTTKNVGKLLQDAAKARAQFAVIIENGTHATVKNLDTQQQDPEPTPLDKLAERVAPASRR